MKTEHIGWRVVAGGRCDDFAIKHAAQHAMQLLHEANVKAAWFRVTKVGGREQLERIPFQPALFGAAPTKTDHYQRGA